MLVFVFSLALLFAMLFASAFAPRLFGFRQRARQLRHRREVLQKMKTRLIARLSRRRREAHAAKTMLNNAEEKRRRLTEERQLAQSVTVAALRIIETDPPRPNQLPWYAKVAVIQPEALQPKPGGLFYFDGSWEKPQTVLVAANTIQDARELLERHFPPSRGFSILTLDPSPRHLARLLAMGNSEDDDPKAAA